MTLVPGMPPSEELRKKLIAEELKLRSKQPEHWAKTKYRKYAKPSPAELERAEKTRKKEKARARARAKAKKNRATKKRR